MLHHVRQLLFVLLVCAAGNVRAAAPTDGPSVAPRDANHWGVYAQLAGRTWQGENGSMTWAWGPNDTLVETGITQQSATIRPGAVPGTLVQEHSRSHVYDGSIGADGSILWIRRGIIKLPYRMSLVDGRLVAVAVTDLLPNGLSAVYTFYEPDEERRSLGRFAILWQITEALRQNLEAVYLGYWIKNCKKMNYKTQYRPIELLINQRWVTLN